MKNNIIRFFTAMFILLLIACATVPVDHNPGSSTTPAYGSQEYSYNIVGSIDSGGLTGRWLFTNRENFEKHYLTFTEEEQFFSDYISEQVPDGVETSGSYFISADRLTLKFSNGDELVFTFRVEKNQLILRLVP